jgi:hypothetical protein
MNSIRNALVVAVALTATSAAAGDAQQKDAPAPAAAARREAVVKYFDAPAPAPAPDAADRRQDASGQDALRQMFTDLAAENVKLRKEARDLRADNEALRQKLQDSERQLRQWRANRGALVVPPQAPHGQPQNAVPPSWKPFEFNGATYYVVPLKARQEDAGTKANTLMQVEPARPAAPAK